MDAPTSIAHSPQESRQEVDETGEGTGVEIETPSEVIDEPFDPDKIKVTTRTMTVDLLMSRLDAGVLKLQPDFQRKAGIWNDAKQSRLIESLLLRIPLPSFYVSENDEEEWEVVDGVQRLTAISRFVRAENEPAFEPLRLRGLEYLSTDFNKKRFNELPVRLMRRIRETEFTFHVIEAKTPDVVRFNIFARLNTGGMPLTHQELRHALVPGRARDVLRNWANGDAFKRATDHTVKTARMADREMILRFLAFWKNPPETYTRRDFGEFLMDAMKAINKMTTTELDEARGAFDISMSSALGIFGKDAFRKRFSPTHSRNPINRPLFESIAVNLSRITAQQRNRLLERRTTVQEKLMDLMADPAFIGAISISTGDPRKIQLRFSRIRKTFEEAIRD